MIRTTQQCWAERGSVIFCFNNTHAPVVYIIFLIYLPHELTITTELLLNKIYFFFILN